jgi:hypothetical protein
MSKKKSPAYADPNQTFGRPRTTSIKYSHPGLQREYEYQLHYALVRAWQQANRCNDWTDETRRQSRERMARYRQRLKRTGISQEDLDHLISGFEQTTKDVPADELKKMVLWKKK